MIDKAQVERRFAAAAPHYDEAALPQREFATSLVEMIAELPLPKEGKALEIGCGTGIFSEKLLTLLQEQGIRYQHIYNDLSPEVERLLRHKVGVNHTFIAGDAELMTWQEGYSVITSAACIQWWHHPLTFPQKAYKALTPQGVLAFSTFLPDNLRQLSSITSAGLTYPTSEEVERSIHHAGFHQVSMRTQEITLYFESLLEILHHLKHTGTNFTAHPHKGLWTAKQLQNLEHRYRQAEGLGEQDPLQLTYHALLVTAIK